MPLKTFREHEAMPMPCVVGLVSSIVIPRGLACGKRPEASVRDLISVGAASYHVGFLKYEKGFVVY